MSISEKVAELDAVRDALVSSVNGKGGNLTADATLWQVKAAVDGIEVGSGEDPTPVVTQPKPTVSVNSSNGLVTAKYTPIAGKVTDTTEKSATLQLTTQSAQTITPGKTAKTVPADRYLTGVQTIAGDNNLSAENIKNGVSIFGVSGSYTGDAVEVTQPKPTVSVNSSNGLVTAKYTPVAGLVKDTAEKSGTLQLTAQAAQTITPGTSDKTIASGRYLTGTQTIKGDANLTAGNIKKGVSIFNVAGSYEGGGGGGGGGGAFDLVAVTSYTPAYNKITSLVLSGMGADEMSGYDLTLANGTYQVTPETADKQPNERIYKHTSQSYYIFYIPEDTTGMYYSYGWAINTQVSGDPWSVMMMAPSTMQNLTEGTVTWYGEMNMLSMSVTIGSIQQEMVAPDIKLKRVTGYNPNTLQYTYDSEVIECSSADSSNVQEHQIYSFNGTTIFGRAIDCEGGSHLLTYIPGRTTPLTIRLENDRNTDTDGYYFSAWQYPSFHTSSPEWYSLALIDGKNCIYCNVDASQFGLWDRDQYDTGKVGYHRATVDRKWSFGALFNSGKQTSKKQMLLVQTTSSKRVYIDIEWNASPPRAVLYVGDGNTVATYSNANLASGWHHFMLTYDHDTKTLTMYVDGVARGSATDSLANATGFHGTAPKVGKDSPGWYIGHVCELKFWDIPLTAEQAMAEYNRAINS